MSDQTQITNTQSDRCCSTHEVPEATHRAATRPRTDIRETETGFLLQVDMPGIDESTAEITVEKNVLTITGTAHLYQPEGFEKVYKESDQRYYERVFRLPEDVDSTALSASVKNGVLTVSIPKSKAALPVRVPINAGK
ncbi:Hsp20/alpha crystallin family protein [Rubinisphaera sp.]|uniref:Hsp20/alpha crystallin family protein n=1 Tax=Rubinisphaera sp. TaxID=2024857 RepID=UPI000C0E4BDE|nr:Hsp20/alpha crystallin family protein [Rubinisphaera sp.]MBV09757.1 hypothetical protein [Rubinisphaera sp.]HCS55747.1 hypothetical protein [Planctomycetaceae bacterium]|tara:strand:- start:811 stop:1224 length:414 start_codon:yes stop_codon:yes gene_type:complete